ncbi:MAG: hypothetical protein JNN27_18550 [Planctomycetes bacterium]|nr:hypothetical protein [Planctomycetota bacterium]
MLGLALALSLAALAALADSAATLAFGWVTPTWMFLAVAASITALAAWSLAPLGREFAAFAALIGCATFAGLYVWPLTPRKLFFRDMQRIEVGMSRSEVQRIASDWRRMPPGESMSGLSADAGDECWFHGQGGRLLRHDHCVIRYADERVASLRFVYD